MSKNYFYGRITSNHLERGIFYDVTPLRTYKWTMGTNQRLFPPYSTGRPPKRSNREMFNAILWIARSGAPGVICGPLRLMETVYARFCKWRDEGVLLTIFQELNAEPDFENLSIDSTSIKAHQHSAGAKRP